MEDNITVETKAKKYVPGKNHPWKTSYKVNLTQAKSEQPALKVKALKIFLRELVDNWDHLQANGEINDIELEIEPFMTMSDKQKAKWLSDFLVRVYVNGVW